REARAAERIRSTGSRTKRCRLGAATRSRRRPADELRNADGAAGALSARCGRPFQSTTGKTDDEYRQLAGPEGAGLDPDGDRAERARRTRLRHLFAAAEGAGAVPERYGRRRPGDSGQR